MPLSDQPLDLLLEEALKIIDRHERQAWMVRVCGNDLERLEDLMSLVEAAEKPSWIDSSLVEIQQVKGIFESIEGIQLGPFELMERIGTGGMGVVYLARQLEPVQRLVAIKVIQREFAGQQILERFQREQQTLANMDHPNIARIIDAGASDSGFVYIVMEYVQGEQILDYCKLHQPSVRARIDLMMQCCLAIQHAHQKGTIHRDIKPSNVLVTLVDGKPVVKVIDFGIAKAMAGETNSRMTEAISPTVQSFSKSLTHMGVSPGTPPYMSPEQYSSETDGVDTRSDIYSLGALLYALLTGLQPFDPIILGKMSFLELKEFIQTHDPEIPSRRVPHLARSFRGDLDSIVLKAMSRDVDQRYQSAGLLMDDLRCYLVDAPVMANPGTALTRLGKFAKRNKLLISASSLAIAGLLMGLVFSIIQERRAIVSEQQAKRQAYASDMLLTSMAIARGNYLLPQEILARHRDGSLGMVAGVTHSSEQRLDWRLLAAQLPQEPELLARFPTKIYFGMDLPHRNEIACGCKDSHLRILDRTSGSVRLDINTQQGEINGLALSPDGSEIACGGDDGTIRFYDIDTGNAKRQVKVSETSVFQIAWTQNGGHFVTVGNEANAKVWRLPDFQLATTLDSVNESLECLGVSRQGKVAFGSDKGVIRIASFDSELPTKMQTVSAVMSRVFQSNRCSTVVFSPSGRILAVGLDNGYLLLMKDTGAAYQIVERVRFPTTVTAIAFNSDESTIALGENNGSAHLLDLPSDWPTQSRLRFTKYFFDQNSTFLSESERHPEQLWNTVARTEPANLKDSIPIDTDYVYMEFNKPLTNVIFPDNYIREWSDASGQTRPGWSEMPKSVIYKNDGIELRFENRHGSWSDFKSLESMGRLTSWSCHPKRIASIVWNERENSIQTFSEDGTVKNIASDRNRIRPVGGQNIHGILPLQRDLLALITSDYEPQFMRLDPDQEERSHLESLLQDQEAGKGLIVREARFLYFFRREPTDKSSVPRSIYQLDVESRLVKPVAQLPAVVSPEYLVGAFGENRLVLVYKENSGVDPDDSPRYGFLCWDTMLNQLVWKQKSTTETPRLPTSSPQGSYVTYIKEQGKYEVCLIDTDRGEERNLEDFVDVPILNVCFSKNDRFLAVSLSDNSIVCFRTDTGSRVWMIKAPGSPVNDMVWSDDGVTLACVSQDGFLRTFDTELRLMTAEILLPSISPVRIRLSPAEDWLYILNREGSLIRIQSGTKSLPRGPK